MLICSEVEELEKVICFTGSGDVTANFGKLVYTKEGVVGQEKL